MFYRPRNRHLNGKVDTIAKTLAAACAVAALALKAAPGFDQDNWRVFALLLPMHAGGCWALRANFPKQMPQP
jgi:hypothetical protein